MRPGPSTFRAAAIGKDIHEQPRAMAVGRRAERDCRGEKGAARCGGITQLDRVDAAAERGLDHRGAPGHVGDAHHQHAARWLHGGYSMRPLSGLDAVA